MVICQKSATENSRNFFLHHRQSNQIKTLVSLMYSPARFIRSQPSRHQDKIYMKFQRIPLPLTPVEIAFETNLFGLSPQKQNQIKPSIYQNFVSVSIDVVNNKEECVLVLAQTPNTRAVTTPPLPVLPTPQRKLVGSRSLVLTCFRFVARIAKAMNQSQKLFLFS